MPSILTIFRAVNNFSVSPQVSYTGCDYEEIKDTHKQLPTNPSVLSICVYTAVQKDTGDSQCFITSAEDLNYTVVNCLVNIRNNEDYSEQSREYK